jgi:hypothetical protein
LSTLIFIVLHLLFDYYFIAQVAYMDYSRNVSVVEAAAEKSGEARSDMRIRWRDGGDKKRGSPFCGVFFQPPVSLGAERLPHLLACLFQTDKLLLFHP